MYVYESFLSQNSYERAKREKFFWISFIVEVSGDSDLARTKTAQPSGFCETYISATKRVLSFKHRPKDAHILTPKLINFLNKSTQPSSREIYPNAKISKIFSYN